MSLLNYSDKTFKFSGKLSIYKVAEMRRELLDVYTKEADKTGKFYLDFSAVESMDGAVLQTLFSLKKTLEKNKGTLEIKGESKPFESLIDILGLPVTLFPKAA